MGYTLDKQKAFSTTKYNKKRLKIKIDVGEIYLAETWLIKNVIEENSVGIKASGKPS